MTDLVTPTPANHHRRDIQGLRAVAVVLVVAFHMGGSPVGGTRAGSPLAALIGSGFVGVDVFFVVSGFVITSLLVRQHHSTGGIRFAEFYSRRARRLLPALGLVSVVVLGLSIVVLSPFGPQQIAARTALAANTFVANIYLYRHVGYFDATAALNPFLHTWSLSVEEQTYLVLPVGLAISAWCGQRITRRFTQGRRDSGAGASPGSVMGMVVGVVLVSIASFALMAALSSGWRPFGAEAPERLAFLGTPARLWEFGVGALLALAWPVVARIPRRAAQLLGLAGVAGIGFSAVALDPGAVYPSAVTVLPVLGAALVIVAGAHPTLVTKALSTGPMTWIGDRSYSWYLWHWPMIVLAVAVWPTAPLAPLAAGVVALLPAWAAHRWVEQPLRVNPAIVGRRAVSFSVGIVVAVALVAGGVALGANWGWGLTEEVGWYDMPNGRNVGCHLFNRDSDGQWPGDVCVTSAPGVQQGVWLVLGDLSADSATPGVIDAAHSMGYGTAQWTRSGCPFLGRTPVHAEDCAEWNRRAMALIDELNPALVVLAADSPAYTTDALPEEEIALSGGSHPATSSRAVATWADGLDATLSELDRRDISTIVVGAVPTFGSAFPRSRLSLLHPNPPDPAPSRSSAERRRTEVWEAEKAIVRQHRFATAVDPFPVLCESTCPPRVAGKWRYYDDRHLTITGSKLLTPDLRKAAAKVLDRK